MPSPEAKLPIDPNVPVPPSVKRASEAADALHQRAYPKDQSQSGDATPVPEPQSGDATPVPEPQSGGAISVPEPQSGGATSVPEPQRPLVPETGEPGSWEHRYHAMKGRYDQAMETIGSMQGQMQEMGDELVRSQTAVQRLRENLGQPPQPGTPRPGAPRQLVTDADRETYGPELLETIARVAREAVQPDIVQVQNQNRQVSQRVAQQGQGALFTELDREVPIWKAVNVDPRFKVWCRSPDVYSGQVRGKLLNAAFQAADAPRVLAFFKGFLAEEQATGQMPSPQPQPQAGQQPPPAPRQAAVALDTLAAPGRAKPATGDSPANAADKPVFTRAQIAVFYSDVRRGVYNGRDADKQRDEAAIFAAQREGRVRG